MHDLIPILNIIKRVRTRRENDKDAIDNWFKQSYNVFDPAGGKVRQMMAWIDEFTTGRFYLEASLIAFEDEADAVIFRLWYKE